MLRIVVVICAVSQLAAALPAPEPQPQPQRPVQVSAGGPRPQPQPSAAQASTLGSFGPSFQQQLSFGPNPSAQISQAAAASAAAAASQRRGPATYQSQQPIIISQSNPSASPATPSFATFPVNSAFGGGAGRQILTLRSPAQSQADDDEYEYEDDDEPTLQQRPQPGRNVVPVTRAPVRIIPQNQVSQIAAGLGGAGRFGAQQQNRQRQPVQQQQAQQPQQAPRVQQNLAANRQNSGFGIDGKRNRLTTPPPIQTVNRYMKQNDDGSITWGYENEDGTFKEETLGADCVVRGKYGYVDPEGNKREYEYQTGNPCDPNKKDQEEVEEEEDDIRDGPSRPQQIAGLVNARPRPVQRRPIQQQQQQPQYQLQQYQ